MLKRTLAIRLAILILVIFILCQIPALAAKRVILMIGDGMGFKHVEAARNYLGRQLVMEQLPVKYACTTYEYGGSYNSAQASSNFSYLSGGATDSASAATSLSAGIKVDDGNIATSHSDTDRLVTMSEYVRMNDKSAGVVSTVPFSHATPAAFASHNNDRNNYPAIAREMITTLGDGTGSRGNTPTLQLIIGGGHPSYASGYIGSAEYTALKDMSTGQGWKFIERKTGLDGATRLLSAASTNDKIFGLFGGSESNIPYRLADGSGADPENPTLADMASAALISLNHDPDGFFLMIEGGAIDKASHSNNINQMIGEMIGFDEAVDAVVDWIDATDPTWSDTLLIVTADHETGYLTRGTGILPNVALANPGAGVLPIAGTHFAWNSGGHTNSIVPLYAKGAGSVLFSQYATSHDSGYNINYLDNTKVNEVMRRASADAFRFTVTADQRNYDAAFDSILVQMQTKVGGLGAFHASPGDIDPPQNIRTRIDNRYGTSAIWYPGLGNHEEETAADMTWIRAEYTTGNGGRVPLKVYTNQDGPAGTVETNYSWDYGNVHFIMLNEYWNGATAAGSDVAADGDIVPALRDWLTANLAATTKPAIIVFGHEPAYPFNRHVGDSLDLHPANRDAFMDLLESDPRVKAYIVGHTHFYSKYQRPNGRVWQIDVGNAGNDGGDGKTFLDVVVNSTQVQFNVWRDNGTGNFSLTETISTPIINLVQAASPAEAKALEDDAYVALTANTSATFTDFLYVEDEDRFSGIRVNKPGHSVPANRSAVVNGAMRTSDDGERYIDASDIVTGDTVDVKPVFMNNRAVGGGFWEYDSVTKAGQAGIAGANGLNNIGLLVRVFGKVTYSGTDYFYIDDGSGVNDGSGHPGVKVMVHEAAVPDEDTFVSFTGVNSCYKDNEQIHRLIHHASGLPAPPFTAYNDVVWDSRQSIAANTTKYGIGIGFTGQTSGPLVDYATGKTLAVNCSFTQSGGVNWQPDTLSGGSDTNSGTDAYNVFNGIVSLIGVVYYGTTGWWVDIEISGLDPASRYEFVTTANRNYSGSLNLISMYTISNADSFNNASTPGVTISPDGSSSTFNTGKNTVNGYVARWTNINPDADGRFMVRAAVGAGGDPRYAYAFSTFKLSQME